MFTHRAFNNKFSVPLLIAAIAALLFIPFLGGVHLFDWDEINFAECAREMIKTGDYLTVQINYQPFWEKPPLFIWMQVLSMKIFGINEYAARLPNALCGIATLCLIYLIGKKLYDQKFGLFWVLAYAGSILPHFYFHSGIIDPWFNLFIFLGVYLFFNYLQNEDNNKYLWISLSAVSIGLAVMTKGPVALLLFALSVFFFVVFSYINTGTKNLNNLVFFDKIGTDLKMLRFHVFPLTAWLIVFVITGGFWFFLQIADGNWQTVKDFIVYQIRLFSTKDAGHGGFFGYHFVVLFFGVFPGSVFALFAFKKNLTDNDVQINFKKWMLVLFWVVLILFSIVKTKIVHYSSLCYFPLTYLAAHTLYKIYTRQKNWPKTLNVLLIAFSTVVFAIMIVFQIAVFNLDAIVSSDIIEDKFAVDNLQAQVVWQGIEFIPSLILFAGILFSIIVLKKKSIINALTGIFVSGMLFTLLTLYLLIGKIEGYTQKAILDFYKSKQTEDCYVTTHGFKSYANLFYTDKKQPSSLNHSSNEWLLTGEIDKTTYIVVKTPKENEMQEKYPHLIKVFQKNGFIVYIRHQKKIQKF